MAAGGGGHGTKSVMAALIANAGIAVAKLVGFLIASTSMPSDPLAPGLARGHEDDG